MTCPFRDPTLSNFIEFILTLINFIEIIFKISIRVRIKLEIEDHQMRAKRK